MIRDSKGEFQTSKYKFSFLKESLVGNAESQRPKTVCIVNALTKVPEAVESSNKAGPAFE